MSTELPPNYTIQEQDPPTLATTSVATTSDSNQVVDTESFQQSQIVIAPASTNSIQFQTGNLGAGPEAEHAAVEGEVQLKGLKHGEWSSIEIEFRTVERTSDQMVELASSKSILFDVTEDISTLPSSLSFSIPLAPDVPQAVYTPKSSLSHSLIATVQPNPAFKTREQLVKSIPIQIRRYTTPMAPPTPIDPRLLQLSDPVPVSVQIPRSTWRLGEAIPVYVTIPAPNWTVIDRNLQLRNITAELIRTIGIGPVTSSPSGISNDSDSTSPQVTSRVVPNPGHSSPYPSEKVSSSANTISSSFIPSSSPREINVSTVITRSGTLARLHRSKTVQVRLVLHPPSVEQANGGLGDIDPASELDSDVSGSITQSTVLHDVSFHLQITLNFLNQSSHSSTTIEGSLPITMVPPLASQKESLDDDMETNYMKKHDRPPSRTVRADERNVDLPSFDDVTGTSSVAPESMDPPSFDSALGMVGNSSGLPTFTESEAARAIASSSRTPHYYARVGATGSSSTGELRFEGEGTSYGFFPENQYDGMSRMTESSDAMTTTNEPRSSEPSLPPPPPALDDPTDPPPTIDDGFHSIGRTADERRTLALEAASRVQTHGDHLHPPPVTPHGGDHQQIREPASPVGGPPPYLGDIPPPSGIQHSEPPSYIDSRTLNES